MSQKRDRQSIQSLLPEGSTVTKWYLSPVWEVRLPTGERLQAYRHVRNKNVLAWWEQSTQRRGYGQTWQTALWNLMLGLNMPISPEIVEVVADDANMCRLMDELLQAADNYSDEETDDVR